MKLLSISECQQWWKEKGPCLHPIFSLVQNYSRSTCRDVIGGCSRVDTLFSTAFCPKDWYGYQSNFLLEQTGCSYLNRKRLGFSKIPEGRPRKVLLSHVWLYRLRDVLMNHVMSCVCQHMIQRCLPLHHPLLEIVTHKGPWSETFYKNGLFESVLFQSFRGKWICPAKKGKLLLLHTEHLFLNNQLSLNNFFLQNIKPGKNSLSPQTGKQTFQVRTDTTDS